MKILFLSVFYLFASQILFAQVTFPEKIQEDTNEPEILQKLNVTQDERLVKMLNWHIELNKTRNGIEGFRVEIFFSAESDAMKKAVNKKVDFLSKYPEYAVHIKYDAPNFKVRIGDFRTKNEAVKLYKKIKADYPVAFVVADKINFPLLKQNTL